LAIWPSQNSTWPPSPSAHGDNLPLALTDLHSTSALIPLVGIGLQTELIENRENREDTSHNRDEKMGAMIFFIFQSIIEK
jgi:hypothetical protein